MKSRAWFEKHGYVRQVRYYDELGLRAVKFPANVTQQQALVQQMQLSNILVVKTPKKTRTHIIHRIVVWAPEGDQKIQVS